ncbi:MAG: hypothetical protein AAF581_01675 [Planctomycetota bacterium]
MKLPIVRSLLLVGSVALSVTAMPAQEPSAMPGNDLAENAAQKYRDSEAITERDARLASFRSAERMFRKLTETNAQPTAARWTNLGNAALQAERLGPAVLAYRRALEIDPDHSQATQNLTHARTLLPSWVPRPSTGTALDAFFFWHRSLSLQERLFLAALAFALAALLIAASIRWRQTTLRNLAILPIIVWGALVISVLADGDQTAVAVVTNDEVVVRASDSPNAQSRFANPLPGGAEVAIVTVRGEWAQIEIADGRDGWVPATSLTQVLED